MMSRDDLLDLYVKGGGERVVTHDQHEGVLVAGSA